MPPADMGTFDHVLRHETKTETADATGQLTETWSTNAMVWGRVRSPNGREWLAAQAFRATVSHMIDSHYATGPFSPHSRLVDVSEPDAERIYNVVSSLDPDGRRRTLLTYVVEVVDPASTDASNL